MKHKKSSLILSLVIKFEFNYDPLSKETNINAILISIQYIRIAVELNNFILNAYIYFLQS